MFELSIVSLYDMILDECMNDTLFSFRRSMSCQLPFNVLLKSKLILDTGTLYQMNR